MTMLYFLITNYRRNNMFKELLQLNKDKIIQIGIHKQKGNNLWHNNAKLGKFLNLLTIILVIMAFVVLFYFGIFWFAVSIVGVALYSVVITKIATMTVKVKILQDEYLFNSLYSTGAINIKVIKTDQIIKYPDMWANEIIKLYQENYK